MSCPEGVTVSSALCKPANQQVSAISSHLGMSAADAMCDGTCVHTQGRVYALNDVWIRPPFGGKGRKMMGQLEAHANGFRYSSPKGEQLDIMYRCGLPAFHHMTLFVAP